MRPPMARLGGMLFVLLVAATCSADIARNILILQSYHKDIWTDFIMEGINHEFSDRQDLGFFIEYMDTKRFNTDAYYQQLYEFYQNKYADKQFDVVIACDDNAYDFARTHQTDLLKNAPIVFCGVSGFNPADIEGRPITGVIEKELFIETLKLAMRLLPETRSVYIIADKTKTTTINIGPVQTFLQRDYPKVKQYLLRDMTHSELLKTVESLPNDSLILFMSWWKDSAGQLMVDKDIKVLLATSNRPVFNGPIKGAAKNWGAIGGYYTSGEEQGSSAAKRVKQILDGADLSTLPVITDVDKVAVPLFNYIQIRRFGLDESLLPETAIIHNLPISVYEIQKKYFWSMLGIAMTLLAGLVALLLLMRIRIKFNRRLHEKDLRFRNLVETANDWIWELDAAGRCVYSSPQVKEILGYEPAEIIGTTPFGRMPPEEAKRVAAVFETISEKRESFKHLENTALHKEGHWVYLESNGVPIFNKKGVFAGYCGINRDISERKKAEQEIVQSRAELDSVFAASPAGIGLVRDRKLVHGNARFSEICGYRIEELVGIDSRLLYLSPMDYEAVGAPISAAAKKAWPRSKHDGSGRTMLLSTSCCIWLRWMNLIRIRGMRSLCRISQNVSSPTD